jgi:hypothetical protein
MKTIELIESTVGTQLNGCDRLWRSVLVGSTWGLG